jgi:hypothetical protein
MSSEHVETSPALWAAVWQLADAWSETPVIKDVSATLPRNQPLESRGDAATGIAALLQHLEVTIGGMMHPLTYGSRIPIFMRDPTLLRFGTPEVDDAEWFEWLQNASRLENAHRITLAWLRSRLGGYPILRAPQLAPGTPFNTYEMTTQFIWSKQEFASGLNRLPGPPDISNILGADGATATLLDAVCRELATKLRQTSTWIRFNDAHKALDNPAKESLREARRELTERLSADRLDEHEENLALPRSQYRAHTTAEVVESLTGPARAYADAFTDVHRLLTLTVCDVFSELVLYGEPWSVPVINVETPVPGEPIVEFETPGATGLMLGTRQVLWLSNSAVADAVRVETKSFNMDLAHGTRDLFEARVLVGTAEGWPASTDLSVSPEE